MTRLFESSGVEITSRTGLRFQLIADPDANTDFPRMVAAGSSATGWAIGNEHPSSSTYGADDDLVIASTDWKIDTPRLDHTSTMTNGAGMVLAETPFYFRWFNTDSADTAFEAGVIYRDDGGWKSDPEARFPTQPSTHEAPLDCGITGNLGSSNTTGTVGWQTMPRALLTSQGTPVRWFVDHGITLAPGDTWNAADNYDSDTNHIANRAEYIAGTDPQDPNSTLKISSIQVLETGNNHITELTWLGASGGATDTIWCLFAATNGTSPLIWHQVTNGTNTITGSGTNYWTHQPANTSHPHFYRIEAVAP